VEKQTYFLNSKLTFFMHENTFNCFKIVLFYFILMAFLYMEALFIIIYWCLV
jgi:hypothetical protein